MLLQKWTYRILLGSTVIVSLLSLFSILQNPLRAQSDIALFIDPGRRILIGEVPYIDFFTVTLITIQYLYVIPVAIAQLLGVNTISVWMVGLWLLMVMSMYMSYRLSKLIFKPPYPSDLALIIPFCIAFVSWILLFPNDFGQREHLFALYAIPWLLLRFCVWEGHKFAPLPLFVFGFVVGIIATVKPYYILILGCIELYWFLRNRSLRPLKSFDVYGFVSFGIVFAGLLLLNPNVLSGMLDTIISQLSGAQWHRKITDPDYARQLYFQIPVLISVVLLIICGLQNGWFSRLLGGFAFFSLMGGANVLMQAGSNPYLHIPLWMGVLICIGLVMMISVFNQNSTTQLNFVHYGFVIFLLLFAVLNTVIDWNQLTGLPLKAPKPLREVVETYTKPGDEVLFIGQFGVALPWLHVAGRLQAGSMMDAWVIPKDDDPTLGTEQTLQNYIRVTRNDLNKLHPMVILDMAEAFSVDYLFREYQLYDLLESNYVYLETIDYRYKVYLLAGSPPQKDIQFKLGDEFTLYSWKTPAQDELLYKCESLNITTWWNPHDVSDINKYTLHVDLIDIDTQIPVINTFKRIGNLSDYTSHNSIVDAQEIDIPCDAEDGQYNLILSLENMEEEGGVLLPVIDSNGADYGQYIFFGEYTVGSLEE